MDEILETWHQDLGGAGVQSPNYQECRFSGTQDSRSRKTPQHTGIKSAVSDMGVRLLKLVTWVVTRDKTSHMSIY